MGTTRRRFIAGAIGVAGIPLLGSAPALAAQFRASAAPAPEWVTAGSFARIYDPSVGESKPFYINDHTFIKAADGTWHLFGITHAEPADPDHETVFAHATAPALHGPWTKRAPALQADPAYGETHLWAPHVIASNGTYYMFYAGGGPDPANSGINLATSTDLTHWTRSPGGPLFRDGLAARDPMVLRIGARWVMFYCATATPGAGDSVVAYRTSTDLLHWSNRAIALAGTGGPTESPFVVRHGEWWYLFVGPRHDYAGTAVFRSTDPFSFTVAEQAGQLRAHAAEVITDGDDVFVSHCGWGEGGVYLAPLSWQARPVPAQTRLFALAADRSAVSAYTGGTATRIGGPAGAVYSGGRGLFATNPDTGDIYHYLGTPNSWTRTGGPGRAFAVTDEDLFGLAPDGHAVFRWSGSGTAWQRIGGPAGTLYAGGHHLLATNPDTGDVYLYAKTGYGQDNWTRIGGPGSGFAASDRGIFGVSSAGVFQWSGRGVAWTKIGGPAGQIRAGDHGLLATDPNTGELYRYDGTPDSWTRIGGVVTGFAVSDDAFYARSNAGVYRYDAGGPVRIGEPAAAIVPGA